MREISEKIIASDNLAAVAETWHEKHLSIVTTNGCFDILHWGHIQYLRQAKAKGDLLCCGINADESVRRLKGPLRPIFEQTIRLRQLAALECVDFVTVFSEDTPCHFIRLVRPSIHVKGADYEGKPLAEQEALDAVHAELSFLPYLPGYSTTSILEKLQKNRGL